MSEVSGASAVSSTVEPIVVNSGESAVTFDDLEAVEAQSRAAKKAEKDQAKEVAKETVKEMTGKDSKDEPNEKAKKAGKNEGEAEEDEGKEDASKKRAGAKKDEPKLEKQKLKGRLGDKELEFDPDAVIPVKINGKEEFISLKDLQGNYSGKVAYDRKFQEMDVERKAFEGKLKIATDRITSIFEEKDPEIRFFKMAELSGQDPVEVRKKFLTENMDLLEKYYGMSEDERNADALAYENRIMKHRLESQSAAEKARKSQEDLANKIRGFEETHKIDSKLFWKQFDRMRELADQGVLKEKITPELVAEVAVKERMWGEITERFGDKLPQKAKLVAIENAFNQGLDVATVIEWIEEDFKEKDQLKSKAIESKIDEADEVRTGKKPVAKKSVSDEVWSFDQV